MTAGHERTSTVTESAHTPGPWKVVIDDDKPLEPAIVGPRHEPSWTWFIATVHGGLDDIEQAQFANAAFIVKAVNAHDALVKALEEATAALDLVQSAVWDDGKQRLTFADLWAGRALHIDLTVAIARAALSQVRP